LEGESPLCSIDPVAEAGTIESGLDTFNDSSFYFLASATSALILITSASSYFLFSSFAFSAAAFFSAFSFSD